jgi:hypothetical protein
MKWQYKTISEHGLRKESKWDQVTVYRPYISCLTGKLILPFTKCMRATWYYKANLGMDLFHITGVCTTKEFVLWSLIKGD